MAEKLTPSVREEKKWQAYQLSLRGQHAPAIARVLGVSHNTTCRLINDAHAQIAKERAANGLSDLETALAEQDAVIAECWKRLVSTKDQSLNVSAILSTLSAAYERKHKLLGLLKERQQIEVSVDLAEELRGLMTTTVRLEYEPVRGVLSDSRRGDQT